MTAKKTTAAKNSTPAAAKNVKNLPKPKHSRVVTEGPDRTHKICSICKTAQPLDKFYRPAKDCRCKDCNKIYAANLKAKKAAEAEAAAKPAPKNTKKAEAPAPAKKTAKNVKK